ncbi:MAG: Zn-ribbon domain-containing OB-fold protein [Candidatus Aenigmarchaeota archaeon]|nr:Zn-ribbon domain-containing OB-fold protein [Candidatus Aenigmarchaeota archaeon]
MGHRSSIPLYWRLQKSKYNLVGTKCKTCGKLYFPPRQLCSECRRKGEIEDFSFSGKGEIISFTVIRAAPEGFEKYTPYAIALIKLEEGEVISGQIVGDVTKVEEGKKVKSVFRRMHEDGKDGVIFYGVKFQLVG